MESKEALEKGLSSELGKSGYFYFSNKSIVEEMDTIGKGTAIWNFAHIRNGATIGNYCNIGNNCYIDTGAIIGDNVRIGNGVSVWNGVIIEDDCFIAPNVCFTNDKYPPSPKEKWLKTIIKKGAVIGANATIICGITIGEYAVIGAGSVVTKDVLKGMTVYGNPAKSKKELQ